MRIVVVCLSLALVSACSLWGETASAPQTARQALLEMFFSKTPGTLVKHLPTVTLAALEKSGALTLVTDVLEYDDATPNSRENGADI
jgi:hypothetical protein